MYQAKHYAENEQNGGSKAAMILSIAVTLAIIFILGILAWALPQRTYSEYERRDLTQMPEFSVESFFKGEYTAQIELSYADTFAFRDQFVGKSGTVAVEKDGGDIVALTGATITSRAVSDGVTAALEAAGSMG